MTGRDGSDTHPGSNKVVMVSRILLAIGAALSLFLAAFHITFPWLFHWETGLSSLSNSNRAIFMTAHIWIIQILVVFACASLVAWRDLLTTNLGRILLLSIGLLWAMRGFTEVAYFRLGVDGSGWRVALFIAMGALYWIPLLTTWFGNPHVAISRFSTYPR